MPSTFIALAMPLYGRAAPTSGESYQLSPASFADIAASNFLALYAAVAGRDLDTNDYSMQFIHALSLDL